MQNRAGGSWRELDGGKIEFTIKAAQPRIKARNLPAFVVHRLARAQTRVPDKKIRLRGGTLRDELSSANEN